MLGWTILFAVMSISGTAATLTSHPAPLYVETASVIFTTLFLLTLLTRAIRVRAR